MYMTGLGCRINAEALNNKGRSPFHVLAQFGENNTTAIFDLFLGTRQYILSYSILQRENFGP
jgi:hypothetical protein